MFRHTHTITNTLDIDEMIRVGAGSAGVALFKDVKFVIETIRDGKPESVIDLDGSAFAVAIREAVKALLSDTVTSVKDRSTFDTDFVGALEFIRGAFGMVEKMAMLHGYGPGLPTRAWLRASYKDGVLTISSVPLTAEYKEYLSALAKRSATAANPVGLN